jgi:ABC-type branched-subunit amino acid transport system substrate-binding protein
MAAALWAGLGPAAADPGITATEIVIGQNITLQGGKNVYGSEVQAGVRTLLDDVNRAGGVNGRRIVLRTMDDENQGAKAEANARQLVDGGVFVLFGSIEGGPSTAVMKAATEKQVPFFGPMAGSPELRRPHQPLVFPVRAEHREEFRALIRYGASTGLRRVGFLHADSPTGLKHLENVKLAAAEVSAEVVLAIPFKSDISDAQLDDAVRQIGAQRVEMMVNHGSPGIYERLIRKARAAGLRTTFLAVNSGSTPLAQALGPLATGMVFSQVVPNPWARKTAIAREYQDAFRRAHPGRDYSYGSLEGYVTAKALVAALKLAGPQPTRSGFVKALGGAVLDLGGLKATYRSGDHEGSTFVDLALVTREGKFLQ